MAVLLGYKFIGVKDTQGRFAKLHGSYVRALRNIVQVESRRLTQMLRQAAPRGETAEFWRGFKYRTKLLGKGRVSAEVYYEGKKAFLVDILEKGARKHPIVARNVSALRFYWERGPRGPGIYFYKSVRHPGVKGTRFIAKAVEQWYPTAMTHFYQRAKVVTQTV